MKSTVYHASELKKLSDALKMLGATDNAIILYLASFNTGRTTVGKLAMLCGMDRSSAYLANKQLCELGVFDSDDTGTIKSISARPPKAILARLRTELRRLRSQAEAIEESMPQLQASYVGRDAKPILQFFSGRTGLHQIADDVLDQAEGEILLYTNQHVEKSVFTELDHKAFIAERLRRGLSIRVLAVDVPDSHSLRKLDKSCKRETRIVNDEPFTSETYIYGNNVAMLSFDQEVLGFIVRSAEFARAQRWMFEEIWKKYGDQHA